MKIVPLLIILYIALIGIIIFDGIETFGWSETPYTDIASPSGGGAVGDEHGALWNLFVNPNVWLTNALMVTIGITFLTTAAAIFVSFITKSDIILLSPIFVVIINAGTLPIISIYKVVYRELEKFFCMGSFNESIALISCSVESKTGAALVTAIIVGPIAIAWAMACVEWWTQRPVS